VIARGRFVALACVSLCVTAGVAAAATPSWTTYRHDGARSGTDPDSTSPVAPTQAWQSGALDGAVYGQPLVYGSTVYVATENDTVYALNAGTGAIVWQKHVATPVPSSSLLCGDISPVVGITSTPALDPATGAIYVVADTWNGSSAQHEMFGLKLADGSPTAGLPVVVDGPGSTPLDQLQRASLALDAGKVIIGYGGNDGDCGSYHGWLVAAPEGGGAIQSFEVDKNTSQGSIWAAGNAPPIDSAGNVWTSTGNGNGGFGYQESVVKLDPNLNVGDWWAPSNWASLDSGDTDLGSSMPLLLPGGLVFQIGKAGVGYLLNASNLGHTGAAPLYEASVCNGSYGGGIYQGGVIYVTCSNGVHALSLNSSAKTFAPVAGWTVNSSAVGPPTFAGGLVWSTGTGNGTLYGLDPSTGATRFSANLGGFEHFASPSAGGGKLFVANRNQVTAFQIAGASVPTPTATALSSSANPSKTGVRGTFTATVTPVPDGGAVAFTDGGRPIAGCSTVPVTSAGRASCTTSFPVASRHAIVASYGGDSSFAASSGALTQVVLAVPPVISHLHATAVHRKLRLSLTVSARATLIVTVNRQASGRIVRHRCRIGARHGKACRTLLRKATLTLRARHGRNSFRPRMRQLAPGRYVVSVAAVTAAGGVSKRSTTTLVVGRH
jgi:outer membrane protein assembly factor BamB